MAKYLVTETRTVAYTIEVSDGIAQGDIRPAPLDSRNFCARGSGGADCLIAARAHSRRACFAYETSNNPSNADRRNLRRYP
jgi:hypothetical protein